MKKSSTAEWWREVSAPRLQKNGAGSIRYPLGKKKNLDSTQTIPPNHLQLDYKSKCES